jgi:hypothetical protein
MVTFRSHKRNKEGKRETEITIKNSNKTIIINPENTDSIVNKYEVENK